MQSEIFTWLDNSGESTILRSRGGRKPGALKRWLAFRCREFAARDLLTERGRKEEAGVSPEAESLGHGIHRMINVP